MLKCFAAFCAVIRAKLTTATELDLQSNGQMERSSKTLATSLPHYIDEYQKSWDPYFLFI